MDKITHNTSELSRGTRHKTDVRSSCLTVKSSAFGGYLPGNPDNIRPSKRGGYWVALVSSRANGSRTLLEELQARPAVSKKVLNWLVTGGSLVESLGALSGNKALKDISDEVGSFALQH